MGRGDLADETIVDAACLRLAAAIESVGSLPDDALQQEFGTDWAAIWSVRNRISHGYMFLDRAIIEDTLRKDIDPFVAALDRIAARLDPQPV